MYWVRKIGAATLLLMCPLLGLAQTASLDWRQIGELPQAYSPTDSHYSEGVGGPFVGIHKGALIIAGGVSTARPAVRGSSPTESRKTWHNTIAVATREAGKEGGTENILTWQNVDLRLPGERAYGASASHALGVIAIGGSDDFTGHSDVYLLRWDPASQSVSMLTLPSLPEASINGSAAVIGDTLYAMIGGNGLSPTADLYALDLSRIKTDEQGRPLEENGHAMLAETTDSSDRPVPAWQRLPPLPDSDGNNPARTHMALVAQNDGRGDKLYVMGGRRDAPLPGQSNSIRPDAKVAPHYFNDIWAYDPKAPSSVAAWTRKADIAINGTQVSRNTGSAVAFGQSHILLFSGADSSEFHNIFDEQPTGNPHPHSQPQARSRILAYNAITDAWASYGEAPLIDIPMGSASSLVGANAMATPAINWDGQIILASGELQPDVHSPFIWSIGVQGPAAHFGWLNMSVLVIYLLAMVMIGIYFAAKNKSTNDYFRGGQNIPWWAAACSMYATMLSSLTYVALPALVYRTDWLVYIGTMMILVVAPIAIYIAMPFFRQIDATSAYEYLSKRFNMPVRLFASGLFTLFHIGRMGIVMALTALALAAVTPLDAWQCVLIMGVLCLIYCTLGGVEAVIWTDTIQTVVLLVGALVCFTFIINGIDGGFSGFIDSGMAADKFRMVDLDFGPGSITRLSIWVIVLGGIGQNLSSYTADQAVVQRYMVTTDTRAAGRSIWANGIVAVPGALLFFCIGTGLYAFYQSQPDKLDPTIQIDQIFPTFIATELPIGIAGLIVAGIFAAAQSTVSTSMNSLATTLVTDFMRPFNVLRSENAYLNAARLLTFLVGVLGTLAGLLFISPEIRSLMEEYFKVIGMFMGALGGLFVLGVSTRKANGWGAMVGIFTGVAVMISAWLLQWAEGYLFATIGILTCLVVGYFASFLLPTDQHDLDGLTLYTIRRAPS